jgi:shikimate dehydrogenase
MDQPLHSYDLVIATVPSGASDHIADELDFQIPTLFEVLYTPYPTRLLAVAKSLGSKTFDGMDLLVEQAMDQIALFSGADFDRSSMRTALQEVGRASLS